VTHIFYIKSLAKSLAVLCSKIGGRITKLKSVRKWHNFCEK